MRITITANTEENCDLSDFDALVEYLNEAGFDDVEIEITDVYK